MSTSTRRTVCAETSTESSGKMHLNLQRVKVAGKVKVAFHFVDAVWFGLIYHFDWIRQIGVSDAENFNSNNCNFRSTQHTSVSQLDFVCADYISLRRFFFFFYFLLFVDFCLCVQTSIMTFAWLCSVRCCWMNRKYVVTWHLWQNIHFKAAFFVWNILIS